jgi:hypothetical protein
MPRGVTLDLDNSVNGSDGSVGAQAARECAAIASDLQRLKVLIADAGDRLLASFDAVRAQLPALAGDEAQHRSLMRAVTGAVTALQFQDMATQLIQHAQRRLKVLQGCPESLAHDTDPLLAATRLQPVRQSAMGVGSIDLF